MPKPQTLKRQLRSGRATIQAAAGSATLDVSQPVPRYQGIAYSGGVMYPRQFPQGVVLDLRNLHIPAPGLLNAREHNAAQIVGTATEIRNTQRTIECSGVLGGNDPTVLETARAAKAVGKPAYWPLSVDVSFNSLDIEMLRDGQTAIVNGQRITGPIPIVRRSELRRIDFVSKGGDIKALARITASAGGDTMNLEQWLASLGIADKSTLSAEQLAKYQEIYDKLNAAPAAEGESEDASSSGMTASEGDDEDVLDPEQLAQEAVRSTRRGITAELARVSGIRTLCKKYGDPEFRVQGQRVSLEAHAIENGWDLTQTELHALRESRPQAPAGQVRSIEASSDALVCAQLMDIGVDIEQRLNRRLNLEAGGGLPDFLFEDINSDRKQRVLEAAYGLRGMTSMEIAAQAFEIGGVQLRGKGSRGVLATIEAAGGSTGSFSNIISTTAKSAILISFEQTPDSTVGWCEEDTGKDFLPEQIVGLKQPGGSLDLLSEGTATEDHLTDKGETIQINEFAKQINVSEKTLINDQLGQIMKMLGSNGGWGQKARNTRPDLVYSILMANGNMSDGTAFFHASHRNLQTGSALSNTTLGTAIEKLLLAYEQGADGQLAILSVRPTHVIVPVALTHTLQTNLDSENLGAIAASQVPLANPILEYGLKPVPEARLQLGLTHKLTGAALNGSSSTWYVVSADAPPILVRYLQASGRVPLIRTTQLSQGRWGVNIDCKFNLGVCLQRFQTAVKSTA